MTTIMSLPKKGLSVLQGGIIYRDSHSFGIWTGTSFTMVWPVPKSQGGFTPVELDPGWGGVV